ncbi:MAG: DUF1236 domain-containing protein [Roseiarcus sp.]
MKTKLIASVAAIGFTTFGVTGLAFAQDNANRQSGNPASERMEKGNANEGAQRKMNERPAQTGQLAAPEKREGETRTGQNMQGEKREGETRTGQTNQGEKHEGETRTGQTTQGEKREGETRTGQAPQGGNREGPAPGGKRDVSVRGNLHISRENASRISENLVRQGHRENVNFNINVGAPLPTDVALLPLPPDVVELAPDYRGYDYVVVNDEIVFVDPATRAVVGMIELGASSADAGPPSRIAGARPCPVD